MTLCQNCGTRNAGLRIFATVVKERFSLREVFFSMNLSGEKIFIYYSVSAEGDVASTASENVYFLRVFTGDSS